jgi:hypothetical protein
MNAPMPQEALERAKPIVDGLCEQLLPLLTHIEDGPNSAIRFVAGENE